MASDPILQPGSTPDPTFGASGDPVVPSPLPPPTPGVAVDAPLATGSSLATDSGLTPNLAAVLAVLVPPFTSLIFLFLEKRSQFVRFWAMQGVLFGAAGVAFSIASAVIGWVLGHIFLGWLWALIAVAVDLGFLVVWILMLVNAFGGKEWNAPVIGVLARQQLTKPPQL